MILRANTHDLYTFLGGSGRNGASFTPVLTARQVEPEDVRAAARSGQIEVYFH